MEEQVCPRCRTSRYRKPSLVLMVNICVHPLCESCVETLFPVGGAGKCPECGMSLKRSGYRVQLFEDPSVEKDVDIRKRVLKEFNKRQEDFNSLREYNDYLEEVETIIYNLVHSIDILGTNKKIEQYKKENKEIIVRNRHRPSREELELDAILEEEKQGKDQEIYTKEELEEKKKKWKAKEALIDELIFSDVDAKTIVQSHLSLSKLNKKEEEKVEKPPPPPKTTHFSSGVTIGRGGPSSFLPIPKPENHPLFVYEPPVLNLNGPAPPSADDIKKKDYLKHIRGATTVERAGGYSEVTSCMRALQEAMSGLFYVPQAREEKDKD